MFGGNFAPAGWAFCDGQLIAISQNDALFTLIGTTYGGDGQETFALPNLQSRIPLHQGNGHIIGEMGGVESVTLTVNQIPSHTHTPVCSGNPGDQQSPQNHIWANAATGINLYTSIQPFGATFNTNAIGATGGSQPHENMSPFLVISFIISLFGIFPSQN
jgi:microcystin-dependent protein